MRPVERITLLVLIAVATLAFAWVISPFSDAIFWAGIVAVVFHPLNERILGAMPSRRNLAALATVVLVLLIIILSLVLVTAALVQEASDLYGRSGRTRLGGLVPAGS